MVLRKVGNVFKSVGSFNYAKVCLGPGSMLCDWLCNAFLQLLTFSPLFLAAPKRTKRTPDDEHYDSLMERIRISRTLPKAEQLAVGSDAGR